jgi:hypothetical protein
MANLISGKPINCQAGKMYKQFVDFAGIKIPTPKMVDAQG